MHSVSLVLLLACLPCLLAVELTFELPDSAKQCFHEEIRQGNKSTVEFQVREAVACLRFQ